MSWDADLIAYADGHPICVGSWNYTHNTSRMIYAVLYGDEPRPEPWWSTLNGMTAPESVGFLTRIIDGLGVDPERFREMNPANGWGSYESLLIVLHEMRDKAAEYPSGDWRCSG